MDRRTLIGGLAAAGSVSPLLGHAASSEPVKARNVVLVHGLFAHGSSWSEVIPRLQAAD